MPDLIETDTPASRRNPLIWIILIVLGIVAYLFLGTDRSTNVASNTVDEKTELSGEIDRSLLVPPGMRARTYIEQIRARGQPYPLEEIFDKAQEYQLEGSLADSHLMYFFCAREGHAEAMMRMAEMSDPNLFKAEDSLLDHADALQSYKWYQKVAELGQSGASQRIEDLYQWAIQASESGDPYARQFLLVVE